jgi:NADPH-dependent glutamate synthase beta subunit-like oxidoreductase
LEDSGIIFKTNTDVGVDVDCQEITKKFDAILLATGSTTPHDLRIPGRELSGIYFAMEFLTQHTKSLLNSSLSDNAYIDTKNKNVIVIGGGDTGTDCIATAIRQGCKSIVNIELLPKPPQFRDKSNPWPLWPNILRTDYGHEEAIAIFGDDPRVYETSSNSFIDNGNGEVLGLESQSVAWNKKNGQWSMKKIKGTETQWDADIVLLAMGFSGPEKDLPEKFGVDLNKQTNIAASYESFATNKTGIFSAGDCRRGQSLVVWAMNEGRGAALAINTFLQNKKVRQQSDQ